MTKDQTNKPPGLRDTEEGGDTTNSTLTLRKRDKFRKFLGIKSKPKGIENMDSHQPLNTGQNTQPTDQPSVASLPKYNQRNDKHSLSVSVPVPVDDPITAPPQASDTQRPAVIFLENIPKPILKIGLPTLEDRIEKTEQLVYCSTLLLQSEETSTAPNNAPQMEPMALTEKELEWVADMNQNPFWHEQLRWLLYAMVEDFAKDPLKDSIKIAEMVLIGPVLDKGTFRSLLKCNISAFEKSTLLDVDHLQGLVQLVQSAPPMALLPDDLVRILSALRVRLQDTHQQSSVYPFHLTLAVSRVLDVMAEHKVEGLDRVIEHEPLSGLLSILKETSSPYVMYQACYAFQALQYISDNETPLQAIFRHSTGVVDGLLKVSSVLQPDYSKADESLKKLYKVIEGATKAASDVYQGVNSVMESGRGVFDGLKEGLGSGNRRSWYAAICVARAFVQAGQLKDLNRLIYEAPCRRDSLFQWGICQLLGEIASDAMWDTSTRQQTVSLIGELYKNDSEWGQDESVQTWMLDIMDQLCAVDDQAVSASARTLLKGLKQDQDTTTITTSSHPFPLRSRLPLPTFSPILTRVQKIPKIEYGLSKLKLQRLKEHKRGVYIPPQATPHLHADNTMLFPLMEKVQEFLTGTCQVFLLLGDSGAGKSTFNLELEQTLWKNYKDHRPIPLYINLPTIDDPTQDLVYKQLQYYNFSDDQIQEMKLHRDFILICDGYDESQIKVNLYVTNQFNQSGQWRVKVVISCRSQYLGQDYRSRFHPQLGSQYRSNLQAVFEEAVISAFSKAQIQQYVGEYVKDLPAVDPIRKKPSWTAEEYMDKLINIPHLLDLVSNPFLLSLSLDALPSVVETKKDLSSIRVTRVLLYDSFVKRWLQVNRMRLEESPLSDAERSELDLLVEDDFFYHGVLFQLNLAVAIFVEHKGNNVVKYSHLRDKGTWKSAFFAPEGQVKLLRESSTVMRSGSFFQFLHRSLLEYFYSRTIYDPRGYDSDTDSAGDRECAFDFKTCLSRMSIVKESSTVQFLAERVSQDHLFRQQLLDAIEESKADDAAEAIKVAAANAISILVRASHNFNCANLQGIKIPGADLSDGQFDSTKFQGADLTNVNLSTCWLRQADMRDARLGGVEFGELPYIQLDDGAVSCAYSPDGRMVAVALYFSYLDVYDTSNWSRIMGINVDNYQVKAVAFSPDSRWLAFGGTDTAMWWWDSTTGLLQSSLGHRDTVLSVAISPSSEQIATGSQDGEICLWDLSTGELCFVLVHPGLVTGVKYSCDGRQLISASRDGTIRIWNPQSESDPKFVLNSSLGEITSLACSPDGKWFASGHFSGTFLGPKTGSVQLWDAVTRETNLVLRGHTHTITGIAFSPDSQRIVTSSSDKTVRLWDTSKGALLSTLTGHGACVSCVDFSPDGCLVVSGGSDNKLRLWDMSLNWSCLEPRDGDGLGHLTYTLDGKSFYGQNEHQVLRQWDTATGASHIIPIEFPSQDTMACLTCTRDLSLFAAAYVDNTIRLWNRKSNTTGPILEAGTALVIRLDISQCHRWIASRDLEHNLTLWDLNDPGTKRILLRSSLARPEGSIFGLAYSSKGDQLICCTETGTVRQFDLKSGTLLSCKVLGKNDPHVYSLSYSPDDQQFALGSGNGRIFLWDVDSEKPSVVLKGHDSRYTVQCIVYSPDGDWIASAGTDDSAKIWRRQLEGTHESWSIVCWLEMFFGEVTTVAWNPVVPFELMTDSSDGSVRVWNMSITDDRDNGGDGNEEIVVFKMLWGSNLKMLFVRGLNVDSAIGLSAKNKKVLGQRGAFGLDLAYERALSYENRVIDFDPDSTASVTQYEVSPDMDASSEEEYM
ncbi:hypothetical protein EC991_006563, partial [Linnemannia zychae]